MKQKVIQAELARKLTARKSKLDECKRACERKLAVAKEKRKAVKRKYHAQISNLETKLKEA